MNVIAKPTSYIDVAQYIATYTRAYVTLNEMHSIAIGKYEHNSPYTPVGFMA